MSLVEGNSTDPNEPHSFKISISSYDYLLQPDQGLLSHKKYSVQVIAENKTSIYCQANFLPWKIYLYFFKSRYFQMNTIKT